MEKQYREGLVNTCFFLPEDISAELKQKLAGNGMTIQSCLATFVYVYLGYDIN